MIQYVFRDSPVAIKARDKADPQKIGEALSDIASTNGGELTPLAVVEAASRPKHVLHRHFEWDDAKAAQAYRLDQARTIIRAIHVEDTESEEGHAAAFISISDKAGTSYRLLSDVKKNADLQARVLAQAERDLEAWENRYKALEDICRIVRDARNALKEFRVKQDEGRTSAS